MTIKQRQLLLHYLAEETGDSGFDPGEIDGIDGKRTQGALALVKSRYGVGADGLIGVIAGTVAKLETPQPVKTGDGTFWDNIRYFTREEFRCPCGKCGGYPTEPKEKLVKLADKVRAHLDVPGVVSSGVRCVAHNRAVGGVSGSRHLSGQAADISFRGIPAAQVLGYVRSLPECAYAYSIQSGGKDTGYVHMDVI